MVDMSIYNKKKTNYVKWNNNMFYILCIIIKVLQELSINKNFKL